MNRGGRQQEECFFLSYSLLSLTNTLADAQTSLTQLQSSFSVNHGLKFGGTPRENEGEGARAMREEEEEEEGGLLQGT